MPIRRLVPAILAAAALLPATAPADDRAFTIQWENDRIADTDRHYSNGARIAWVSGQRPSWVTDIFDAIDVPGIIPDDRVGFALGHSIYTPENTSASALVTDDRPYAGWFYGAISVHEEEDSSGPGPDIRTTFELDAGIVGPWALARQVQNGFHDIIGVSHSNGWAHQLDNEPGLMLIGEKRWRTWLGGGGGIEFDAIPSIGGSLGNVMTFASAGAMLRIGQGLDVDFGPPLIRPSLSGLDTLKKRTDLSWYVFADAQGRAVARDIFLDGNTFSDSHSVDKKHFVGDFQLGAAVIFEGVRFAVTQVFRTREFEGQRQADRFGSASLTFSF
jgi:lipid A 3-O-deacylase